MKSATTAAVSLVLPLLLGCDEEKPYTPFEVATSLPDEKAPIAEEQKDPETQAKERPALSRRAPDNAKEWKAFDRLLTAPSGTRLQVAIPSPASGSDTILAWSLPAPKKEANDNAGLWTHDESGKPIMKLLGLPDFLPRGTDCRYSATLEKTGPGSITSRVRAECATRLLPGSPNESLAVLVPERPSPVLVHLQLQPAPTGESLGFVVNSKDRDGDSQDDVELLVSLTSPKGTKESLPFRWLSRTAGASRQPDSPKKTLAQRASRLTTGSVRKKERGKVPEQVDTLFRLLSAMCGEYSTQRLATHSGAAIPCGELQSSLTRLTHARTQALVGEKQLGAAIGTAERAGWIGRKPTEKESKALAQLILTNIEKVATKRLARFELPLKTPGSAYRSPLHFSDDGQLWARTPEDKTKRLTMKGDPPLLIEATEDEPEKKIEPPEWDLNPKGPGGQTLLAAIPSCQRSEVQLSFSRPEGAPPPPMPLPLLAPRPGNCRNYAGTQLTAIPQVWNAGHLSVVVEGQLFQSGGHDRPAKEPIAWGTQLGIVVQKGRELKLWTGEHTEKAHHCVAGTGAEKIACLKGDSVVVLSADAGGEASE